MARGTAAARGEIPRRLLVFRNPKGALATFVRIRSFALEGIDAVPITVEVDVSPGIPAFDVVGLPDAAVRESRERVRAAIRNGGWTFPAQRITVNLAPAYTRKGGAGFDLAIAVGVLAASGHMEAGRLKELSVAGELALDGTLRPVLGALAMGLAARNTDQSLLILPCTSAHEAALAGGCVLAAAHLHDVVRHLKGIAPLPLANPQPQRGMVPSGPADLADVRGQAIARRALEVAAAGSHNLLMVGPPGAGKSMLARCLPSILPRLSREEALEVSRIHSVAGLLEGGRLLEFRPYRSPHHCASRAALLGGGYPMRPGEITLSHRGVLFLDELPEFRRDVLEGLRQPLEEGCIQLSRSHGSHSFPARPMLVAASNPCPCGYLGDSFRPCTCPPTSLLLYRARLSGPLIDRFDLQVFLAPVSYTAVTNGDQGGSESSAAVRKRVERARKRQARRLTGTGHACNAEMGAALTRRYCAVPAGGAALLREAVEKLGLSLRGHDRALKVARTIADLEGSDQIDTVHLAEALQYRRLDRGA